MSGKTTRVPALRNTATQYLASSEGWVQALENLWQALEEGVLIKSVLQLQLLEEIKEVNKMILKEVGRVQELLWVQPAGGRCATKHLLDQTAKTPRVNGPANMPQTILSLRRKLLLGAVPATETLPWRRVAH
eukprot:scaffold3202_cov407-Prasinococcus_capsulatus_cf.AAC.4